MADKAPFRGKAPVLGMVQFLLHGCIAELRLWRMQSAYWMQPPRLGCMLSSLDPALSAVCFSGFGYP